MTVYGYRTAKWTSYGAWARTPSGACYTLTACATSRKMAYAMIAREADGDRIESFRSAEDMTQDEREQWGFAPETIRPTRIDWSALDQW